MMIIGFILIIIYMGPTVPYLIKVDKNRKLLRLQVSALACIHFNLHDPFLISPLHLTIPSIIASFHFQRV
jgi:hypothetical protein